MTRRPRFSGPYAWSGYTSTDTIAFWLLQLQQEEPLSNERIVVQGEPTHFHKFFVRDGLEALRKILPQLKREGDGVVLVGDVGVTIHFGDILRRAEIPSRIQPL